MHFQIYLTAANKGLKLILFNYGILKTEAYFTQK